MKGIRFIGDGDDMPDCSLVHLDHPITDHTLCGETLDGDTGTAGSFERVDVKAITCPSCAAIIKHCRGVNTERE